MCPHWDCVYTSNDKTHALKGIPPHPRYEHTRKALGHGLQWGLGTYSVFLFIEHKGGDGLTLVSMGPGLSTNMDSRTADAKMVGGARDSTEGRRHLSRSGVVGDNQSG